MVMASAHSADLDLSDELGQLWGQRLLASRREHGLQGCPDLLINAPDGGFGTLQ
jgi:hypothetical protein